MQKDFETTKLIENIAQKGLEILEKFKFSSLPLDTYNQYTSIYNDIINFLYINMKHPDKILNAQYKYLTEASLLLKEQLKSLSLGQSLTIDHKYFNDEKWQNNLFCNLLAHQYILATKHMNNITQLLEFEDVKLKKRINFFIQQYLQALSPENFLHTNPHLIETTIQDNGHNLLKGMLNFLDDINTPKTNFLHKMTDLKAFKLGENIAITKGKVIFKNDLMELIQYTPTTKTVRAIPLLMIPPWINKYYILDLSPKNSLVKWLVDNGISVFMISWVNPSKEHENTSFFDYLDKGPLQAIDIIKTQLNVKKINTLGFCIGGTLLSMLLGYLESHPVINCATFLTTLIDFQNPGDIEVYIDDKQISFIEEKMKHKGYLEGEFMAQTFNSLRARDLIWSFFIKHYLKGESYIPFDLLYWNSDSTNMPRKMHSEYLRKLYLNNQLIQPNKFKLNKKPLNLHNITTPSFFIATNKDHIAPWQSVYQGYLLFKGKKRFLLGSSGHIAGVINPPDFNKYNYYYTIKDANSPSQWINNARLFQGSWWNQWFTWLKKYSGKLIDAKDFRDLPLKGIENAPGSYVRQTPEG